MCIMFTFALSLGFTAAHFNSVGALHSATHNLKYKRTLWACETCSGIPSCFCSGLDREYADYNRSVFSHLVVSMFYNFSEGAFG